MLYGPVSHDRMMLHKASAACDVIFRFSEKLQSEMFQCRIESTLLQ